MKNYLLLINANFLALGLYAFLTGSIISAIWVIIYGFTIRSIYKVEEKGSYFITILLNFAFVSMGGSYAVVQFFTKPSEISLPMMALLFTGFVILPLINIWYIYKKSKTEIVY